MRRRIGTASVRDRVPGAEGRTRAPRSRTSSGRCSVVVIPTYLFAAPMGTTVVNRACGPGPVTCVLSSGWPDYSSGSSSQLPGLRCRVGGGPVGAPAAGVAARTNELDADERRRIIGSGEGFLSCWWWGRWRSRRMVGGVVSQAPIRRLVLQRAGRHDHVSGDRAAQSNDRARPGGRLMPQGRACPGLGDPPGPKPALPRPRPALGDFGHHGQRCARRCAAAERALPVRSSSFPRRAASTTFAPSAASIAARPAPIPVDAPVTSATRPASTAIAAPLRSWPPIMPAGQRHGGRPGSRVKHSVRLRDGRP